MKLQSSKLLRLASTGAAGLAMAQSIQAATVLTGLTATNDLVPSDHGSNAVGTPNVTVEWTDVGQWDQYDGWPNDPGDGVYQIDGAGDGSVTHTIVLTPDAGWNVLLSSLDLNVWAGGGDTDVVWSLTGTSSGVIGSGTFSQLDGTVSTQVLNLSGSANEALTLSLQQTSGTGSYLAMDNLSFDQVVVPEPSGVALGALGLGALAMRRRRQGA